jgi:hypothetical protein
MFVNSEPKVYERAIDPLSEKSVRSSLLLSNTSSSDASPAGRESWS